MTDIHAPAPKHRTRDIVALIAKLASQPSTWRGGIMFLTGLSIYVEPELAAHISALGMALAGLVGMLVDDAPRAE